MDETEKPDPSKPWYPKCIGHTPFKKKENKKPGHGTDYSFWCRHCNGTKMYLPVNMALGKIICGYAAVVSLLIGIGCSLFENDLKFFYGFGGLACIGACFGFWANHRFSKWRKWAKENGYTGE